MQPTCRDRRAQSATPARDLLVLLARVMILTGVVVGAPAVAAGDGPAFHEPPAVLPAGPGVVVRTAPMDFVVDPAATVRHPGSGRSLRAVRAAGGGQ